MSARLIQLPSGDWVRPEAVREISRLGYEFSPSTNEIYEPRVRVFLESGAYVMIRCETPGDADRVADEIAALVNEQP